jgi:ABC-2 type transport system permease protein
MIGDAWTVLRKELREIFFQRANACGGRRGGWFSSLVVLGAFGVFFPLLIGAGWLGQPGLLVLWAWVALFTTTSITADAFAGERERHTLETLLASPLSDRAILLGKVAAATLYGWGMALLSAAAGVVTANLADWQGRWLFYPVDQAVLAVVLSLLAAGLSAMAGVLVSLRASGARQAGQLMGTAIMVLLFIPILAAQAVPASSPASGGSGGGFDSLALGAAVVLAVADGILLAVCLAHFRRGRVSLE